ncbi:MAG TPA: hypothetical protein VFA19_13150 [Gaiellaceae bacterium]|nr:hypothetical protein [Gaiellaceae bacterium]
MATAAGSETPERRRVPFFGGRFRRAQIVLTVLTVGIWLLAPLSIWLWRTGRRRTGIAAGAVFFLIVAGVVAAIAGSGSKTPSATTTSTPANSSTGTLSTAARAADDSRAKGDIARALKVIASDYQVFGNYEVLTPYTLGNQDHMLRGIPSLSATSTEKTFTVSIRSASGTTFAVHGNGLRLSRTCSPKGSGCKGGTWAGASQLALPKVPVLTAADKAHVQQILTASVDHYANLLSLGEQALGSTQYANANTGLAAFNDPNSAASRFSAYRKKSNPEGDLSFLNSFKKADNYYSAANEPKAISTWRDDMNDASVALNEWVNLAVGWQIREHTTLQLQAAEHKVTDALAKARLDIAKVVAGR